MLLGFIFCLCIECVYMYVCMCICVSVCVYVCMSVYIIYVYIYIYCCNEFYRGVIVASCTQCLCTLYFGLFIVIACSILCDCPTVHSS